MNICQTPIKTVLLFIAINSHCMLFCPVVTFGNITPALSEDLMCRGSSKMPILHLFILLLFQIIPKNNLKQKLYI